MYVSLKRTSQSVTFNLMMILMLTLIIGVSSAFRGNEILGVFLSLFTIALCTVLFFSFLSDKRLAIILIISLALKILLSYINLYIFPLPASDGDVVYFNLTGERFADYFLGYTSEPPLTIPGTYLFTIIIGITYLLFGKVTITAQLVVILLSLGVIYLIYKITLELSGSVKASRLSAVLALAFPTFNLYSALLLRENLVSFFTALSVYTFILGWKRSKLIYILISVSSLLIASASHSGVLFIGFAYALMLAFYNKKKDKWSFLQIHKIAIIGATVIFIMLVFGDQVASKIPSSSNLSSQLVNTHLENYATARAAYLVGFMPGNFLDIIIQTPIRMFYFLFTPFPNMISTVGDIAAWLDAMFYLVFSFYAFKGLKIIKDKNKSIFWILLLCLIFALVVFSWGTSNYGAAVRHRQKIVFIFMVLSSIGWTFKTKRKRRFKITL